MALIVEDGSGVVGANTYRSLEDIRLWAEARGVTTIPTDDAEAEILVIKAMDFIERLRDKFAGSPSSPGQALSFPRDGIFYECDYIAADVIPTRVKDALTLLTIYASQGIELEPIHAGGETKFLIRQKLGPIEREYSEAAFLASSAMPAFYPVSSLLAPFLRRGFGQLAISRA